MADLGKLNIVYFPQELIDLNEETAHHPDLKIRLDAQENKDIYITINEIAAFLGIVLDGMYTQEDVLKLCADMIQKLRSRRSLIIH